MERGRVAIDELARYREAMENGDSETMQVIARKFDPQTDEGKEFLSEYFAYFGYGYLQSPEDIVPNVPLTFYAFRVMVGIGCLFILLFAVVLWTGYRKSLERTRWLQYVMLWAIPFAYIASMAGWVVAEVGRQPWTIQDLLPTVAAVSRIDATSVMVTFFIFALLFTALLIAEIKIMTKQISIGPKNE